MPVTLSETCYDCTVKEVVFDIANIIYATHGHSLTYRGNRTLDYLLNSQHPTEQGVLKAAELIYELFFGDSPEYEEDEEGIEDVKEV